MPKNVCQQCVHRYEQDYCLVREDYIDGEITDNCEDFEDRCDEIDDYFEYFEKKLDKKLAEQEKNERK